jgi:hypothetical protein
MSDWPVRVQIDIDGWLTSIPCERVELSREAPGWILLFDPLGLEPAESGNLKIIGDDVLVLKTDDVVSVEGDVEHLGPFLGGQDG